MSFFRERNKIQSEYSGYQEASDGLRSRLAGIVDAHSGSYIGVGQESHYLHSQLFDHETRVRMNKEGLTAIRRGTYDEVFEAIEIFLTLVSQHLYFEVYKEVLRDIALAFHSSGSVYAVNETGDIVLKMSEETAAGIRVAEESLEAHSTEALDFFRRALHDLLTRAREANDIVKDFAIAMEDYITSIAGNKDYKTALHILRERGVVAPTQQGVLEKLYAYRGDAHGVAHSGNTAEPSEADAVWFLETLVAQMKMIEAKIK